MYDHNGEIQCNGVKWEQEQVIQASEDTTLMTELSPIDNVVSSSGNLQTKYKLKSCFRCQQGIKMTTALSVEPKADLSNNKPSLILRRPGNCDLWTLAKQTGSSVDLIRNVNNLVDEPNDNQLLLIPVI